MSILEEIKKQVNETPVVLYMKGTKEMPVCGFSAQTVSILKQIGVPFDTHNILEDEALRAGIKEFSNWPTIPQLYVKGEFIGGCDIITQMAESGDLQNLLKEAGLIEA